MTADESHRDVPPQDVKLAIWEIVRQRVPSVGPAAEPAFEQPLTTPGIGLDSVQILDILIVIEDRFGVTFPEQWLLGSDMTISSLASFVQNAGRSQAV